MSVELPSGKSIFAVWAPDSDAPGTMELRMKVGPAHGAKLGADPNNRVAGPLICPESPAEGGTKIFGSLVLFEANSLEEVREKIEQDIYWTSGVWDKSKLTILPFLQRSGSVNVA
ncbi:hypothetical protein M407DRAFT_196882 [Tulasnella calospora MUT 4182]|uniref:YCII-related domain-containing protein n=1 Tax=Tulasnella calospora MUT 4182 TaxID=1051891 RepID=A0A0C3Q0T1_9AGAM|nr:hypothetical protein M407DRAFT_196882 [Tulasnella calospora MUT 4182]